MSLRIDENECYYDIFTKQYNFSKKEIKTQKFGMLNTKTVYNCQHFDGNCYKEFDNLKAMYSHQQTHFDFDPFLCLNCGYLFNSIASLKMHYTHEC